MKISFEFFSFALGLTKLLLLMSEEILTMEEICDNLIGDKIKSNYRDCY